MRFFVSLLMVALVAATSVIPPAASAQDLIPATYWDEEPNESVQEVSSDEMIAALTDPGYLDEEAIAFLNDRSLVDEHEVAGFLALMFMAGPCPPQVQLPGCEGLPPSPKAPVTPPAGQPRPPVVPPAALQPSVPSLQPTGLCFDSPEEYKQFDVLFNADIKQKGNGSVSEPCLMAHYGWPHLTNYRCAEGGWGCDIAVRLTNGKFAVRLYEGNGQWVTGGAFSARRKQAYGPDTGANQPCMRAGKVKTFLRIHGLDPNLVEIPPDAGFSCPGGIPEVPLNVGTSGLPSVPLAADCPDKRRIDDLFGGPMEREDGFEKCVAFSRPAQAPGQPKKTVDRFCPSGWMCDVDMEVNGKRGNWLVVGNGQKYTVYGITGRLSHYSKAPCDHLQHWWDSYLKPRGQGQPQALNVSCPPLRV